MKLKKIIFIIVVSVIIFVMSDKFYSVKASKFNDKYLSELEKRILDDLVLEKLKTIKYSYELISGFNKDDNYILVEGEDSYLIYDRELSDYLEYSTNSNSIYSSLDLNTKKYYLGPTYYFSYKNEEITDLYENKKLNPIEISEYKIFEEEFKENYIINKQEFTNFEENILSMNIASSSTKFISYDYYFENLNFNMGTNMDSQFKGSCSYVALGMLLSYYDTTFNDNVIAENRDITVTMNYSSSANLNTVSYIESPGINNVFHEELINLGRNLGYTRVDDFSIQLSKMGDLLKRYFNDRGLNISTYNSGSTNKLNFCKQAIDSNIPVIIRILGTDQDKSDKVDHAVIGYGYDNSGIFANFGWIGRGTSKVNINGYTLSEAFYIKLNEEHVCSNNYLWTKNGCSGSLCPCGNKTCNHKNRSFVKYNLNYHKYQCDGCGDYTLQEHNNFISNGFNECRNCGYNIAYDHFHVFTYKSCGDGMTHIANCSCGYSKTEACMGLLGIGGVSSCSKCKQLIKSSNFNDLQEILISLNS